MEPNANNVEPETNAAAQAAPPQRDGYNGVMILAISLGISMIACCLLIPQADENRRMLYQCQKLQRDLDYVNRQIEVNGEFINRVGQDPVLAERLAQRQMKLIRKGSAVLELKGQPIDNDRSPFALVNVAPPPPLPEYQPVGGRLARLVHDSRTRLYMIGGGLMLLALGLVLGYSSPSQPRD